MFSSLIDSIIVEFIVSVIASAAGFLVARLVVARLEQWRFGGWRLVVIGLNGHEATSRPIGVVKAKSVLDDDADLSVFVKGVASPYGWLNCDPVTVGQEIGLFVIDRRNRRMVVDLRKNPPGKERKG